MTPSPAVRYPILNQPEHWNAILSMPFPASRDLTPFAAAMAGRERWPDDSREPSLLLSQERRLLLQLALVQHLKTQSWLTPKDRLDAKDYQRRALSVLVSHYTPAAGHIATCAPCLAAGKQERIAASIGLIARCALKFDPEQGDRLLGLLTYTIRGEIIDLDRRRSRQLAARLRQARVTDALATHDHEPPPEGDAAIARAAMRELAKLPTPMQSVVRQRIEGVNWNMIVDDQGRPMQYRQAKRLWHTGVVHLRLTLTRPAASAR